MTIFMLPWPAAQKSHIATKLPAFAGETVISRGWLGLMSTSNPSSFEFKPRMRSGLMATSFSVTARSLRGN
jgi:hypothetical protein